jgi:hypothetical protein
LYATRDRKPSRYLACLRVAGPATGAYVSTHPAHYCPRQDDVRLHDSVAVIPRADGSSRDDTRALRQQPTVGVGVHLTSTTICKSDGPCKILPRTGTMYPMLISKRCACRQADVQCDISYGVYRARVSKGRHRNHNMCTARESRFISH